MNSASRAIISHATPQLVVIERLLFRTALVLKFPFPSLMNPKK